MHPAWIVCCCWRPGGRPLHYWLRPIKSGQLRFWNFGSHFIRVQIFQIDLSTLPLILSVSKYFRYICGGRNEHLLISLFRIILSNYELLTFLIFPRTTTCIMKLNNRGGPGLKLPVVESFHNEAKGHTPRTFLSIYP